MTVGNINKSNNREVYNDTKYLSWWQYVAVLVHTAVIVDSISLHLVSLSPACYQCTASPAAASDPDVAMKHYRYFS